MSAMSRFTQKAFYRAGFVAGAMLLMPSILWAQDTGSEAQSQPPLSADDETPIMYREIVVTARRRDERLQDVPVSVSAFSARSEEHTSELPSLMSISYAVFSLK